MSSEREASSLPPLSDGSTPGNVVRIRGRAWEVCAGSGSDVLRVVPFGGSGDDETLVDVSLELEPLTADAGPDPTLLRPSRRRRTDGSSRQRSVLSDTSRLPTAVLRSTEQGSGLREAWRSGIEEALTILGQGFVSHPENGALRRALASGKLSARGLGDQVLCQAFRLMLILLLEHRDWLRAPCPEHEAPPAGATPPQGDAISDDARPRRAHSPSSVYRCGYGLERVRRLPPDRNPGDTYSDYWEGVKVAIRGLASGESRLGLPALGGVFSTSYCASLDPGPGRDAGMKLENRILREALFKLDSTRQADSPVRVDWKEIAPEELGGVYEELLELIPQCSEDGRQFRFAAAGGGQGHARRSTGSYYTPDRLVRVLLDSALEPVVVRAPHDAGANPEAGGSLGERAVDAILGISVVDPACGTGHFLLAAARRLATHVARAMIGPEAHEHACADADGRAHEAAYRRALGLVVNRCIYGVDINPVATELCKLSLWIEVGDPAAPLAAFERRIRVGNSLLDATPECMREGRGGPVRGTLRARRGEGAGRGGGDAMARREARRAPTSHRSTEKRSDGTPEAPGEAHARLVADTWCAAFFWPSEPPELADLAPSEAVWVRLREGDGSVPACQRRIVRELADRHRFFHWRLQFPDVFASGGFDLVLGNPPWIAHAGRAAQSLPPGLKRFYSYHYESFAGYPTTHAMFVTLAARSLKPGGYLGLIVPSSLSELDGYAPARRAHDSHCEFKGELVDFGEGQFPGVTQPCMALVSRRRVGGRIDAPHGTPWPMERPDLSRVARGLIAKLGQLPLLPPELFGERGLQSNRSLLAHFRAASESTSRFTTPIREGTDVREFRLLAPRYFVDRLALGSHLRAPEEFAQVRIVIRQTARYPIAALSDGFAFRNSLVAGFESEDWPAPALLTLLNSALIRWFHYVRFRDARQPVMPQLKIGHLRAIPAPPGFTGESRNALGRLGLEISSSARGIDAAARALLDASIYALYGLSVEERCLVASWHAENAPKDASHSADDPTRHARPAP